MDDSTSRIEPVPSRRDPESQLPVGVTKQKPRPKSAPKPGAVEPAASVEVDEEEKHDLDTLA